MARPILSACAVVAVLILTAGAARAGDWVTRLGSVGEASTPAGTGTTDCFSADIRLPAGVLGVFV